MRSRIYRLWPSFFLIGFLFFPKFTFAADWVNVGFADKNVKTVYADPKNNQHIIVSLSSYLDNNYNYYTENGGTTWQAVNMGGSMTSCNNFVVNPKTSNEVWAGCAVGLFHSTDGGKNFSSVYYLRNSQNVFVSVTENGVVFATSNGNNLYRSIDGLIWDVLAIPGSSYLPLVFLNKYNSNEIYLSQTGSTGPGLYKSTDLGTNWVLLNNLVPIRNGIGQMTFDKSGKICATAGGYGIGCSTNGGFTWSLFVSPNLSVPHEYQHSYRLEQNPDDDENLLVLASTWGGLDTKIYSYKSGSSIPEVVTVSDMTGAITISQGVVFSWSPNNGWTKGIWRNDGIAVVPEYLKKHPVIIVPGILGSWYVPTTGKFELDPIKNTYSDLYNSFVNAGYEQDKYLFAFPYQWRNDNKYTSTLLANKIKEAKLKSGSNKVDIVAHSMGGIVTRFYIQSDIYDDDINKIFFLGTPQLGSTKAYTLWEAGYTGFEDAYVGMFLSFILKEEALTNGFIGDNAVVNYIHSQVTSIKQLLPVYSYLNTYTYPFLHPQNSDLELLNTNKTVLESGGISIVNIIGENGPSTISNLSVTSSISQLYWEYGQPIGLNTGNIYDGVSFVYGDGTVTTESQSYISGKNYILGGVSHNEIPKSSIKTIFNELGIASNPLITDTVNKILMIKAYSPVDFYVLAPDGKKIGFNKNGEIFNEIEGAFYTGNDSETEFITIPNPLPGIYKVITYGTDTGEYEIEATYADDYRNISFSSSYVGQAELGIEDNLIVTLSPETDSIKTNIEDKTAPNVVIGLNKPILSHWDTLVLSCAVSDDESGVEEFIVKIDGDNVNCEEKINLFEQSLGSHIVEYMAKDKVGNVTSGEKQYLIEANYNSLIRDIVWLNENKHFKNKGDAISLLAQVEISRFFDLFERWQKSADSLSRALQLVEKSKEKNRIDTYGYDMIIKDINYILEGK